MQKPAEPPVFLIGAARSGTTIVASTLAAHPDIALWDEPKYVWREGGHGCPHDARKPEEATPKVRTRIRRNFSNFLERSGRRRFLEKTPSNCFRIGFMHRVFPDARFLHVRRDGRDAAASALGRWCSRPDDRAIARRLRRWEIPLAATHLYLPDILREFVLRRFWPARGHVWGPRYPGLRDDLARGLGVPALCARQWAESEASATRELAQVPASQVFRFDYEAFVRSPDTQLREILDFAGLEYHPDVGAAARRVRQDRIGGHRRLPPEQRQAIETICVPAMQALGMPVAGS